MLVRAEIKKLKHPPRKYALQYTGKDTAYLTVGFKRYPEIIDEVRGKISGFGTVYWTIPASKPLIHNGRKHRK